MTVYTATEQAYKNGYEAGWKEALSELTQALDRENQSNTIGMYDIGYHNGLTIAKAIAIKLRGCNDDK